MNSCGFNTPLDTKIFGQRLRLARERLGLSQEELASKLERDQRAISEYEHGKRKITAVELPLFAKELNVPILYFYEGEMSKSDLDHIILAEFHRLPETTQLDAIEVMRSLVNIAQNSIQK